MRASFLEQQSYLKSIEQSDLLKVHFQKGGDELSNTYEENVCAMLRRRGLSSKYEHPGIYCIKLDGQIVYIGKSENMLVRVA